MLDTIVVGGYFGTLLLVGWCCRKRSAESYWVAERGCGAVSVTASLVATIFGATSTLGVVALGYSRGLTGAWWSLIGGLALIPLGLFLAAKLRRLALYTLPDVLHNAYGAGVSMAAAGVIAVSWCGVVAAQMVAGARLLSGLFPLDYGPALAFVAVVVMAYTWMGGQLSVIRTDLWQLVLFFVSLLTCLALLRWTAGVDTSVLATVPASHWSFPVSDAFGWYDLLVFYPLIVGLPYLVGPDIYSRVFCARDELTARRAVLWAAAVVIPVALTLAFLGLALRARWPGLAAEQALPTALSRLAPSGLKGILVTGLLAGVMSSADTTLMSASTIVSLNVLGPLLHASAQARLRLTRLAVVVLGCGAWWIAGYQQGIISSLLLGYTVFVGGVVLPTLAAFDRDRFRATAAGAMWAVVIGGLTAFLGAFQGGRWLQAMLPTGLETLLAKGLGPRYPAVAPLVASLLVLVTASAVERRKG